MSALPPKADIGTQLWNVRFVPKADIKRFRSGAYPQSSLLASSAPFARASSLAQAICEWTRPPSPQSVPASRETISRAAYACHRRPPARAR
jgi:hypothetical protein